MTIVEQVSFADLYIHALNPRLDPPQAEIDALATNIRELGLIQNLAGLRDDDGKVGVIAGGRRLRALAQLQDDERFALVPVKLADDEATAAVWAAAENSLRSALHPADEIREYAQLRDSGVGEAAIAIAFGVTKAHVKRRLRLARLPEPVMAALRADKIGLTEAATFVVCDDLTRIEEVLAQISGHPGRYSEESIKRLLKTGAVRDTDRRARFVGVPAYREAGGRISTDLFGGEVYLDDVAILDACFAERLAALAEETRERDGWQWVQTRDNSDAWAVPNELDAVVLYPAEGALTEEEAARHDELIGWAEANGLNEEAELARLKSVLDGDYTPEQRQHAGVVLYVSYGGEVRATHAMVLPADQPAAAEAGIIDRAQVAENDEDGAPAPEDCAPKLTDGTCVGKLVRSNGSEEGWYAQVRRLVTSQWVLPYNSAYDYGAWSNPEGHVLNGRFVGADSHDEDLSDLLGAVLNSTYAATGRLIEGVATGVEGAFDVGPPAARKIMVPDIRRFDAPGRASVKAILREILDTDVMPAAPRRDASVPPLRNKLDMALLVALGLSSGKAAAVLDELYTSYARWRATVEEVETQMRANRRQMSATGVKRDQNPIEVAGRRVWEEIKHRVPLFPKAYLPADETLEVVNVPASAAIPATKPLFDVGVVSTKSKAIDLCSFERVRYVAMLRMLGLVGNIEVPLSAAKAAAIADLFENEQASFLSIAEEAASKYVSGKDAIRSVVEKARTHWHSDCRKNALQTSLKPKGKAARRLS